MTYTSNTTKSAILVHIDTAQPQNITFIGGNKSNIKIQLADGGISIPPHSQSRCLMSLYSASIPISMYNIRTDNNTFILQEGIYETVITVPIGNYTSKTLAFTIQSLLNTYSYLLNTYTVTYSPITNKFLYTTSDTINSCYLVFPSTNSPYIQMGFNSGSTNVIPPGTGLYSVNSISMYDKFSLYIRSNLIQGQATYMNGKRQNILERLNIQSFNSVATYNASPLQNKFHVPDNVSEIDIQITTDDPLTLLDLNGLNYQITLMFSFTTDLKALMPENFPVMPFQEPDFTSNLYSRYLPSIPWQSAAEEQQPSEEQDNQVGDAIAQEE